MADKRPTPKSLASKIKGPESRPGYEEYISDPRNQDAAVQAAMDIASALLATGTMGGSLALPPIFNTAKNAYNLYRSANKADQYFRPNTSRPNSMQPEEMLRTDQIPTVRPKELKYEENYRGTRTEPDPRLVAGDEGFGAGASNIRNQQRLTKQAEDQFARDQLSRFDNEGGTTSDAVALAREIALNRLAQEKMAHNDRIAKEQQLRDMEVARWENEGGSGDPRSYSRDFVLGETPMATHGVLQGRPYYGPLAPRSSSELAVGARKAELGGLPALRRSTDLGGVGTTIGFTPRQDNVRQFSLRQDNADQFTPRQDVRLESDRGKLGIMPAQNQLQSQFPLHVGPVSAAAQQNHEFPAVPYDDSLGVQIPQQAAHATGEGFETDENGRVVRSNQFTGITGSEGTPAHLREPVVQVARDVRPVAARVEPAPAPAKTVYWGDPDRASDFFRADKQMRQYLKENTPSIGREGSLSDNMKRGGAVGKKPDAIHKALEIIHHLITR